MFLCYLFNDAVKAVILTAQKHAKGCRKPTKIKTLSGRGLCDQVHSLGRVRADAAKFKCQQLHKPSEAWRYIGLGSAPFRLGSQMGKWELKRRNNVMLKTTQSEAAFEYSSLQFQAIYLYPWPQMLVFKLIV